MAEQSIRTFGSQGTMNVSNYFNAMSCTDWCMTQIDLIQKQANYEGLYLVIIAVFFLGIAINKKNILLLYKIDTPNILISFLSNIEYLSIYLLLGYLVWVFFL
jgi:hypothetical protein